METEILSTLKKLKNKNVLLWSFLLILFLIIYIVLNKDITIKVVNISKELAIIILNHILSIALLVIIFTITKKCFKYSDMKSQEDIDFIYKPRPYYIEHKYIKIELVDRKEGDRGISRNFLEINIKNNYSEIIKKVKGRIFIYKNRKRVRTINFDVEYLQEGYSEIVFFDFLNIRDINWDEVDLFIEKIELENNYYENLFIKGLNLIRTYTEILNYNKYYDNRILGIRTRYNLIFLKNKIKDIINMIKFHWNINVYSFTEKIRIDRKKVFTRIIIAISILIVTSLAVILLSLLISDLINIIKELRDLIMK
ncbi:hypothetical protein [Clostridium tertium]